MPGKAGGIYYFSPTQAHGQWEVSSLFASTVICRLFLSMVGFLFHAYTFYRSFGE